MAWKDQLTKVMIGGRQYIGGSFRGASFFVEDSSASGGRRGVVHEIPFSEEDPYIEDTGRKSKPFRVTAYTLVPNYLIDRNKLIDALEKGAGDLVHPYFGKIFAFPHAYDVSETSKSGGRASFSIEFEKTISATPYPSSKLDAVAEVKSRAAKAVDASRAATGDTWTEKADGLNSDFLQPAEQLLADLGAGAERPFSPLLETAQSLAEFRSRLDNLVDNAASLVLQPFGSFDAVKDALTFAFRAPTLPAAFLDLINSFKTDDRRLPSPPAMTDSRDREAILFAAQSRAIRTVGVAKVCEIASGAEFETVDDAETVRGRLVQQLDDLIDASTTDDEYQALVDLQVAVERAIPNESKQLRKRLVYTPPVTTNSINLSHRLYGNTSYEQEIVRLNSPKHPGFILGLEPLQVLSNE